jgi:hypothetical protein
MTVPYLSSLNSMSVGMPLTPGSSTCQGLWPTLAELNETPGLRLAILPRRQLHQARCTLSHARGGLASSATRVLLDPCVPVRRFRTPRPLPLKLEALLLKQYEQHLFCAPVPSERDVDRSSIARALAAVPTVLATGLVARCPVASGAHPLRARDTRESAGVPIISCLAISLQIALLDHA